MSIWKAWRWAGVLSKHGSLSRIEAFKMVRMYYNWAMFGYLIASSEMKNDN